MRKSNFKFNGREGVKCPKVQVDILSYEPLHKRIERFLSGDASSLDGADTTKNEYDEPEKVGDDDSVFEPQELRDDILNQPLDNLDIAEIRCDSQKLIAEKSNSLKNKQQQIQQSQQQTQQSQQQTQQPEDKKE